jgi:DNA-binding PadR family transcriptional regulator
MHGYELVRELEHREVGDWAEISRAQVYYSIKKALSLGWLTRSSTGSAPAGPERQEVETTSAGRSVLSKALAQPDWTTQRSVPPFLTWLALSHHLERSARREMIDGRRRVVVDRLDREKATLAAVLEDSGEMVAAAALMVDLTIRQLELELTWLNQVEAKLCGR